MKNASQSITKKADKVKGNVQFENAKGDEVKKTA